MRVKAIIAYDGTTFEGFQRQTHTPHTVTTALETALGTLGIEGPITGSGRTDAGVHASGQVIHFDLPPYWQDYTKLRTHLNRQFRTIRIKHITPVPDHFHARHNARRRIYRYLFQDRMPSLWATRYVAHVPISDWEQLREALACFAGEHDFGLFKKSGAPTRSNRRILYRVRLTHIGPYHAIYFEGDGFLRAQVRMMLAAAFGVANGTLTCSRLREQLEHLRRHTTLLAPPQGLYLARVLY